MPKPELVSKTKFSDLQLLEQIIDVRKLLNNVFLEEEKLIEAALSQPGLVLKAGMFRVQQFHKRAQLETKLATARSEAGRRWRNIRDAKGKKSFSEGDVKERIELDQRVAKYRKRLDNAYALEELGKIFQEVFRTRSDAIRTIVNAGKVSVHAKELALLKSNKALGKGVKAIRRHWEQDDNED
jgi:hypothetical protein